MQMSRCAGAYHGVEAILVQAHIGVHVACAGGAVHEEGGGEGQPSHDPAHHDMPLTIHKQLPLLLFELVANL